MLYIGVLSIISRGRMKANSSWAIRLSKKAWVSTPTITRTKNSGAQASKWEMQHRGWERVWMWKHAVSRMISSDCFMTSRREQQQQLGGLRRQKTGWNNWLVRTEGMRAASRRSLHHYRISRSQTHIRTQSLNCKNPMYYLTLRVSIFLRYRSRTSDFLRQFLALRKYL
jgi:hypothetical protein